MMVMVNVEVINCGSWLLCGSEIFSHKISRNDIKTFS